MCICSNWRFGDNIIATSYTIYKILSTNNDSLGTEAIKFPPFIRISINKGRPGLGRKCFFPKSGGQPLFLHLPYTYRDNGASVYGRWTDWPKRFRTKGTLYPRPR